MMVGQRSPAREAVRERASITEIAPGVSMVTTRAAAAMLGVDERTIRRAIVRGDLEAMREGRAFRIPAAALERYRDERQAAVRPPRPAVVTASPPHLAPLVPLPPAEPARFDHLPLPLSHFIGRERETDALASLLRRDNVRLVTLTGPGGVGKTRLALRVADAIAPEFASGAAFVSLAPVRSPDLVLSTIVQALAVRELEGRPPLDRLVAALKEREALLVLDNFEQVTAAGPALVDLLLACRRLKIVVTSRAPLHLSGERLFPVPPLSLPPGGRERSGAQVGAAPTPDRLLASSEAVQLFVDRAQCVAPEFVLTERNAADVAAICQRTDGLPLAIELAAARVRLLSPADLLARMARQLPVLSRGPRDQPRRLRAMRDAIAWSYDLLSPKEQTLFRRLAVFVGGFTLDAAEAIGYRRSAIGPAPEPGHSASDLFEALGALVDQSLVHRGPGDDRETRFGMLETVREFGLEMLAAHGDEPVVRDAHADWCLAFAERAEPELAGPDHVAWFERIAGEIGNIRAAHAWLFEREDASRALRLGNALGWFWQAAGNFAEGRALFSRLITMPGSEAAPLHLAAALGTAGSLEQALGNFEAARERLERSLALCRVLGDQLGVVSALRTLGSIAIDSSDLDAAEPLLHDVLHQAPQMGAGWEAASASNLLGVIAFTRGDYQQAIRWAEEAAARWHELDDIGHVGVAQGNLARALLSAGDRARAAETARDVLQALADAGDDLLVCDCFDVAAGLAAAAGDWAQAGRLLAASGAVQARIGTGRWPGHQAAYERLVRQTRSLLGETVFAATWAAGQALTLDQATAEAFTVLERTPGGAPPELAIPRPGELTSRQRDILRLLVEGLSDKEIAASLGISRHTVSNHLREVRERLGVSSRAAAVAFALRDGLV